MSYQQWEELLVPPSSKTAQLAPNELLGRRNSFPEATLPAKTGGDHAHVN
jgi:hypothetical protein